MYGLKSPSQELIAITILCMGIFKNMYSSVKSNKKILEHLMNTATKTINKKCSILQHPKCNIHYLYLLELLFRSKIYKECKWENANIGKRALQNADKLRVLQNR